MFTGLYHYSIKIKTVNGDKFETSAKTDLPNYIIVKNVLQKAPTGVIVYNVF